MKFKLAAIDLDDTLLTSRKNISKYTAGVIRKIIGRGITVVLATGRNFGGSIRYHELLGLDSPMINCGGAVVVDKSRNELFKLPIDFETAREVLLFAKENDLHAQLENSEGYYFERHNKYSDEHEIFYGFRGQEIPAILERSDITVLKILILSEPERIKEIKLIAKDRFPILMVSQSLPKFLEFNNPDSSKGRALQFLSGYYAIKKEEIIAFGDSELDFSMMDQSGFFVAVENASKTVRSRADFITDSNDNDGVGKAMIKLLQ